jgi:hypothetical protein
MDKKLRELERRIAQGDPEAEAELKRYLARTRSPAENLKQAFIDFLLDYDDEFDQYADEVLEVRGDALYFFTEDCTIVSYIEGIGPLQDVVDEHNFYTEPNEDIWGFTFHPKKPVKKKANKRLPAIPKPPRLQPLSTFIDENPLSKKALKRLKKMFRKIPMSKWLHMDEAVCSHKETDWGEHSSIEFEIRIPLDIAREGRFVNYLSAEEDWEFSTKQLIKTEACLIALSKYLIRLLDTIHSEGGWNIIRFEDNSQTFINWDYKDGHLICQIENAGLNY